jgi:hypothetical protein
MQDLGREPDERTQEVTSNFSVEQSASPPFGTEVKFAAFLANRVQNGRAFGGRISVTNRRLTFVPLAASQAAGGSAWEVALVQVLQADVAPRRMKLRDGSLRRRLRVLTFAGQTEYFVVWRPRKKAALIKRLRSGNVI